MATILSRKNWTSTRAGGSPMSMSRSRGIVVHYPAAGGDIGVISQSSEESRIRGWRNYHVGGRGWADLGYNYLIGQSGRIYEGRGLRVGAHAGGHNSTTVGVLFIVGDNEPLTAEAKQAFKALRAYLRKKGVGAGVWGHQQMSGASTRCPGPYIMADIRNGSLAAGSGGGAAVPGGGGSTYKTVNKTAPLGLYDKDGQGHTRIEDWQTDALGYDEDEADGMFGPDTETDTKALQRQLGVTDDGLVGDDTMAAWEKAGKPKLKKSAPSKPSKPKGDVPGPTYKFPYESGGYIGPRSGPNRSHSGIGGRKTGGVLDSTHNKRFVSQLGKRGWNISKGGPYLTRFGNDGKYGDEMASLIAAFQRDQGLTDDELAGKSTWDAAFKNPVT